MRQPRADSVTGAVVAMREAQTPPPAPPECVRLRAGDYPFWKSIICARAPSEWSEPELVVAAQLARCQADIEREQERLDTEGSVILNDRKTPIANPRFAVLEQLSRREMALLRTLTLNAGSKGDIRDLKKTRAAFTDAVEVRRWIDPEGLIPMN